MPRPVLIVVAGFPRDTLSSITNELVKHLGHILVSTGVAVSNQMQKGHFYNPEYIAELAKRCQEYLKKLEKDFGVLVLYAKKTRAENERIIKAFAPACALIGIEHQHQGTYNREMYNRKASIQARKSVESGMKFLNVVFDHLNSRANKTPLLLPVKNFLSEELLSILTRLSTHDPLEDNPKRLIKEQCDLFQKKHPMVKNTSDNLMCFQDSRGVLFRAPGKARHGKAWDAYGPPHLMSCYLGARARLGASYRRGFHYDCCTSNGRISGNFKNCHNENEIISETTHINIAPNDFLRWKS